MTYKKHRNFNRILFVIEFCILKSEGGRNIDVIKRYDISYQFGPLKNHHSFYKRYFIIDQ